LALPPAEAPCTLSEPGRNGGIVTINGGGDCFAIGGHFLLGGVNAEVLTGSLPAIVRIREESDVAVIRWSLDRMMQELREPQPGGFLLAENLAYLILVQALRLHLADGLQASVGWFFALADKQVSRAISVMHDAPARRWTLQELAEQAGMSRSPFAQRFKKTVGVSAMEYLTSWRMLLAADRLTTSDDSISEISAALGYESESAFSAAFKRLNGCSPRQYGRERKRGSFIVAETLPRST
jgi:AraC-like DNA-binding protein